MNVHKDHALAQLFGQDLDTFVGEHLDAYEDAKKRWTECSIDEWTAGADGMHHYMLPYPYPYGCVL